eukprot:1131794_1
MAPSFCFFAVIICILQFHVKSFGNPCFNNELQSTCDQQSPDCAWSPSASSCICNTDPNINLIYLINTDVETDHEFNWNAISISIPTISNEIISFDGSHDQSAGTAIEDALSLFASYNTHYGQIRNILVVLDTILLSTTQTKLETQDIQTITASSSLSPPRMVSFISCQIHQYQQHLSIQRQQRVLLQSANTHTICCQCLTVTATEGCLTDKACEERVCDTDKVCCTAVDDPSHPSIGWDGTCVHFATTICNENTLTINNPLPIPRSDEHNNGNDNDSSDQGNVHEVIHQESDSSHQYIQVNTNVKVQSDSSGNNVRRTKQMRGRGRGRGRVVNYGSGSSSDSSD